MDRALSRLCFAVSESRGRRYPELVHPYRNAFQRDRDRIVHARAFRRLEDKTQVFTAGISDHFRNRLTHTIEVAQIARTVAGVLGLEENLTEALALAHDIGHPPFGHSGEQELNRRMTSFGEHFDHNLHALRIVESFEQSYASFPGLNLTFEVREGIVKHSRDLRPGEFAALDEYRPEERPPLEAQLIDLADEIAYSTADLDDAHSAQFFDLEALGREVPPYAGIRETVETQFPGAAEQTRFRETLRKMIDALVTGLIEGTLATAREAGVETGAEVRRLPARLVRFTPEVQAAMALLKAFLHRHVYDSPVLAEERRRSSAMMGDLFDLLVAEPQRLPSPYREQAAEEPVHRIVCDYIAGMTDGFFRRTYQQMLG
jgi:dGTPase